MTTSHGLLIRHMEVASPAVLAAVREVEQQQLEGFARSALELGARALGSAKADQDLGLLRAAVLEADQRVTRVTETATREIERCLRGLTDQRDGLLARGVRDQLDQLRQDVGALVASEDSPVRVAVERFLLSLGDQLRAAAEQDRQALQAALSLDVAGSPLHRLKADLAGTVELARQDLQSAVAEVKNLVAVERATRDLADASAGKGLVYEHLVCSVLEEVAHGLGDMFEAVGATAGSVAGCKSGDAVTTVAERTAPGRVVRIAIEAKDRTLSAARWAEELDRARDNRQAVAALGVVHDLGHMPGRRSVHVIDPLRVLVCHLPNATPHVLAAAYHLIRVQAVQAVLGGESPELDSAAVQRELDETLAALRGFDALDRALSQSSRAAATASDASSRLRESLTRQIGRLSALLEPRSAPAPSPHA